MGGEIELYVVMRGTAKDIIQKYQHQLGFPSLPPYYALGIYTGSQLDPAWGTPSEIYKKIDSYIAAKMPIEGVVLDQYTPRNFCPYQATSEFDLAEV
jgi:alpha-glucosidase (family GH31 glycosyl hydrolase)